MQAVDAFAVFGGVNTTADTLPSSFLGDQYTLDVPLAAWSRDNSTDGEHIHCSCVMGVTD